MEAGQQFNLRWNNYTNNMLQVFMEQLKNEILVDCTLSSQGQFLKAHQMVLSASSPYFQDLFKNHQSSNPVIIFNGINFLDLKLVVEFMYRGEIKVLEAELEGLLAAAETLQVKGLSNVRSKLDRGEVEGDSPVAPVPVPQPGKQSEAEQEHKTCSPMILRRKKRRTTNSLSSCCTKSESKKTAECETTKSSTSAYTETSSTNNNCLAAVVKTEPPDLDDTSNCRNVKKENDDDEEEDIAGWETSKMVVDVKCEMSSDKSVKSNNRIYRKVRRCTAGKTYQTRTERLRELKSRSSKEVAAWVREERPCVGEWLDHNGSKIPRPPNAFMIFANEWRRKLACKYPDETNKDISVRLGIMWKNLGATMKEGYYKSARLADLEHKRKYPGYYYSPKEARMRKIMRYDYRSTDFKSDSKQLNAIIGSIGSISNTVRSGRWKSVSRRDKQRSPGRTRHSSRSCQGVEDERAAEKTVAKTDPGDSEATISGPSDDDDDASTTEK